MRTTRPWQVSALKPQPTPQYAHVVTTLLSGLMGLATAVSSDKKALFDQGLGRAGLHARPATNAWGFKEGLMHSGHDLGGEPASIYRQGEGALYLLACPHAAATHDTFGGIE